MQNTAAAFVDYDNLYAVLNDQSAEEDAPDKLALEIFREVRRYLSEGDGTPTILGRAYADFGTLPDAEGSAIQSALHRVGLEPVVTPLGFQGNTSELQLTIDVTTLLHEQPEIHTVVLITGDRPFLPLVRRIRERGHRALVAAVNPPQSADAPRYEEEDLYLDARNLLSGELRETLFRHAPDGPGDAASSRRAARNGTSTTPTFKPLDDPLVRRTIEITEEHFGQYEEVYLTPLLRKLSDILGDEHDPKSLVSDLEAAGAVRLEKREGYPYDYTVLIVNDEHPDVQEIQDDFYTRSSEYDAYDDEYTNDYNAYDDSAGEPDAADAQEAHDESAVDTSDETERAPESDPESDVAYDDAAHDNGTSPVNGADAADASADDAASADNSSDDDRAGDSSASDVDEKVA